MKSTPYNPATLSPVETMLLKRLEAMEAGFVQLLQVIGQNLPATVQAIQAIGQGAGQTVSASEEAAAASYLIKFFLFQHVLFLLICHDRSLLISLDVISFCSLYAKEPDSLQNTNKKLPLPGYQQWKFP